MKTPESELFEIAESQQGYFTFQQAIAAGFSDKNHAYHVKAGDWVKVFRGIYRPPIHVIVSTLYIFGREFYKFLVLSELQNARLACEAPSRVLQLA